MIHTHTFPNGFRVIYEKPRNSILVSDIQVFCKVGSAMETADTRGVSHFIEHMVFKGTKKMPLSKDISKTYDEIGAYFNATTNKSYTNYIVKCEDVYVKNCILVLGDMLMNSVFNKTEFEKEKKVVVEETILREDSGSIRIENMYDASVYRGSSYENPIDTFVYHKPGSFDYDKVIDFYKMFYRPSNMAISIVSHVPFKKFIEILTHSDFTQELSSYPVFHCPNPVISYDPQTEPQYIIERRKGLNTMHLVIGFRTCSQYSPDKYALNILSNILGGFMNARLFSTLRAANGLTYSSYADTSYYSILGDFSISAETDPAKLFVNKGTGKGIGKGVLPLLVDIIVDLQKHGVTIKELCIAKSNLKGSMTISEESNSNACFHNGSKLILYDDGTPITSYHDRYIRFYKDITQKNINDVIKKYFIKSNMTLCILGEHIPTLKSVKSICDKIQ
jgi:predicted Zn-dependent peptidase